MRNSNQPFKFTGWYIHVVAWGVLLGLPLLFSNIESKGITTKDYLRYVIIPTSLMVAFYMNFFLLIDRYLFAKRTKMFIAVNVGMTLILMLSIHAIMSSLPPIAGKMREHNALEQSMFLLGNTIPYLLTSGLAVAIKMTDRWYKTEALRKDTEQVKSQAELDNLKSQLNPHFLFNTLNNIYSLIAFSPEKAQEAVYDLSRLLRYVLYDSSNNVVPLGKEIEFVTNYIELMHIRLPEHVKLETNISIENEELTIAPLLFISLIENAFKHGVSNNQPSFIAIEVTQERETICCVIKNSYFPKTNEQDKSGSGIGLPNLKKRLDLIYPNTHCFTSQCDNNQYTTTLTVRISK